MRQSLLGCSILCTFWDFWKVFEFDGRQDDSKHGSGEVHIVKLARLFLYYSKNTMFFGGGDPFEQFGGGRGGGRGGPRGPVDNEKLYQTLGVAKDADENEIRKAYKKLALKNHPDKGGDVEKVQC